MSENESTMASQPLAEAHDYTKLYLQLGLLFAVGTGLLIWRFITTDSFYPGFEVYGSEKSALSISNAKKRFVLEARRILFEGVEKYKQNPFQVVSASGPKIVFPSRYYNELRNIKCLSLVEVVRTEFFSNIPGFYSVRATTHSKVMVETVRQKLTQAMIPAMTSLCREADPAIEDLYGSESGMPSLSCVLYHGLR